MNYKEHCRTCLNSNQEMRHIETVITIGGNNVRLTDILREFYDYKVVTHTECIPDYVCMNCVYQLTMTYSFKLLIESSNKTLEDSINSVESNDYYDCEDEKPQPREIEIQIYKIEPNIYCVECKEQFSSTKYLNDHCTANHPVKSLIGRDCEYCNEKFDDFRSLVLHRKLHIKPYLCENCWEGFYIEAELSSHTCAPNTSKNKIKSEKTLRQCDQCGKSYPPGYIRMHMLTHSNNRPYSCKYCPKRFKVPGGLNSHILWNHKRTRNHTCEVCNATFISSSARSSHIRKNHLKEKKYGCESCGKRFFSKSELQRHSLTHTGVKNFHCHLCNKSYQTRYGLNIHLKSHSNVMNL